MKLADQKCIPCRGDTPKLEKDVCEQLLARLGGGWEINADHQLECLYPFTNFTKGLAFVNLVAAVAEEEDHHPDLLLSWGKVCVTLWTHVTGGLSESDFILAAKIDRIFFGPR